MKLTLLIFIFLGLGTTPSLGYSQDHTKPNQEDLSEFGVKKTEEPKTPSESATTTPSNSDLQSNSTEKIEDEKKGTESKKETTSAAKDENEMEADDDIIIPKSIKQNTQIEWYLPEIGETKRKRRTRVIIPGKTTPGTRVFINSKAIIVVNKKKKVGYLPTRKALTRKRVATADKDGLFALELDLPNYDVQLPIGVVPPGSRKVARRYQLNLSVDKEKVRYTNLRVVSKSPAYTKRYGLWFGTGYNYLKYSQSGDTLNSNLNFQTLKGPSIFAKGWAWLTETWDVSLTYKMSPGNTKSSEEIMVKQGSYEWLIYASEATYYPESLRYDVFDNFKAQLAFRFGIQHHTVPYLARTSDLGGKTMEVQTNEITMATGGFKFLIREHSKFTYELFMRYQYPVNVGDTFEMDPKFAFDGSVGTIYEYSKNWRMGLFFYGQWHEYNYKSTDAFRVSQNKADTSVNGSQSLFFSNIEFRAGYEFN